MKTSVKMEICERKGNEENKIICIYLFILIQRDLDATPLNAVLYFRRNEVVPK